MLPHELLGCLNVSIDSGKSVPIVTAPPIPSAPADLELIAQLKSRLQYAELRIRVLEERLRLMQIEKYGAGGEKLSHAQLELFELEPVVNEMIEQSRESTRGCITRPGHPANIPAARNCLRIFLALSGFCPAH